MISHFGSKSVHSVQTSNIEDTYGNPIQQLQQIALSVNGGQLGVYVSVLSGWQDTLLANKVLLDSNYWSKGRTDPKMGHSGLR